MVIIDIAGDIFILLNKNGIDKFEPWIFIETKLQICTAVFSKKNDKILMGTRDGCIHEMKLPN